MLILIINGYYIIVGIPYTQSMIYRLTRSTITHIPHNLTRTESQLTKLNPLSNNHHLLHSICQPAHDRNRCTAILGNLLIAYSFHDSSKNKAGQDQQIFRTRLNFVGNEVRKTENQPNQTTLTSLVSNSKNIIYDIITQLTKLSTNMSKSENRLNLITQIREEARKKISSPQFQEYLNRELKNERPQKMFYAINNICNKIKSKGIDLQEVDQYRVCQILTQQLFNSIPVARDQLVSLAQNISSRVIELEEQIKREQEELAKQIEKQQQSTPTEPHTQSGESGPKDSSLQVKIPQTVKSTKSLRSIKVSLLDLSTIILNLSHIPKDLHRPLFQVILNRLNELSFFIQCAFMLDCVVNEVELSQNFLKRYHNIIQFNLYRYSYRYSYICFIKHYMFKVYSPIYSPLEDGRRTFFTHEFSERYDKLYKYVKLMALEYEVAVNSLTRLCFEAYSRRIFELDMFLNGENFTYLQIIKLYNVLSSTCFIGMNLVNNGILKELTVNQENIGEFKQFILNFMKNLEPQYIYYIDEKTNNQINQNMLNRLYLIANQILKLEPSFLLEISTLLAFFGKKAARFKNYLFGNSNFITETVLNQIKALEVHKNGALIVNESKNQIRNKVLKIMNLLEQNYPLFDLKNQDLLKFFTELYRQFMKIESRKINQFSNAQWKFIFQLCLLLEKCETNEEMHKAKTKLFGLYQKFCEPYIAQNQKNRQENLIRQPRLFEEHILRIANMAKGYFKQNATKTKQIENFINNNLIYNAKSIIKEALFDIILLLDSLSGINPEIYAYLYGNFSTFVVYIKSHQQFYLNSGKNFDNVKLFFDMLVIAIKNFQTLKNVQNKNKLRILKFFASLFWHKLTKRQIAQFLIILGKHHMVTDQISELLSKTKFSAEDISGLDPEILTQFKLRNKSLSRLLTQRTTSSEEEEEEALLLSNTKTQQQLKKIFQNKQVYQLAMKTSAFTKQNLIPAPPEGAEPRVKMIYICLKIVYKIRNERDFSVDALTKQLKKDDSDYKQSRKQLRRKEVDLSEQIQYIKDNGLIKTNKINQFKLGDNQQSVHYEMIESWNYSDEFSNLEEIPGYNNAYSEEDPYQEIMLLLIGNFGLIRKLVKNQIFFSEMAKIIKQLKLEYTAKGCLMAVNQPGKREDQVYLFCSKAPSIKFHIIYAYILTQMGYHTCIVEEKITSSSSIKILLMEAFIKGEKAKVEGQSKQNQAVEESEAVPS